MFFLCINICRVPRKQFEREADKLNVQISSEGPASVNAMKQTCEIVILAYFTLFLKALLKPYNIIFLTLVFSKQNGVSVKLWYVIMSSQCHNACNVFASKNADTLSGQGSNTFPCNISGLILIILKSKPM